MRWNKLVCFRQPFVLGVFSILICAVMGCGGGKGKVSGNVTLDGKPLPAGTITFHPSKGTAVAGNIKNGQYAVARVPAGDTKVTVETVSIQNRIQELKGSIQNFSRGAPQPGDQIPEGARKQLEEAKKQEEDVKKELKELQGSYRPIPEKYNKTDSSGLTLKVKSGTNTLDVPLSSK